MGGSRWDANTWDRYSKSTGIHTSKRVEEVFKKKNMDDYLNPARFEIRESCDSVENPNSTPIIIALDVTGSMGRIPFNMIKTGLPTLMENIYSKKPIPDPHIMFMGIGDAEAGDEAPLQVSQFEADIRITQQLEKLYIEGCGGGNSYESYILAWYFAHFHTKIDCMEKRGKKGYLFTIGDELPTPYLRKEDIKRVFGDKESVQFNKITNKELLELVSREYNVYHILIEEGSACRYNKKRNTEAWKDLLGQNLISLSDYTKLSEVIVSTLQVVNGEDIDTVSSSWSDSSTSLVVKDAIKGLAKQDSDSENGLVVF